MRIFSLFFLIGTALTQLYTTLPAFLCIFYASVIGLSLLAVTIWKRPRLFRKLLLVLSALFIGVLLSTVAAKNQLQHQLPPKLEGKDIVLQGIIKDIPDNRRDGTRFKLQVNNAYYPDTKKPLKISGVVKLGWYQKRQEIHAGEQWQLRVRLKRPSGFMNSGGFDYEKWLFTQRIIATGYVRKGESNQKIQAAPWWAVNHIREEIDQSIRYLVKEQYKTSAAILSALTVAQRSGLNDMQWQVFKKTGTSHLIAISGLHIAIVAGFAFFPIMLLWQLFPRLNEKLPLQIAGSIAGVVFAAIYALLAGFSLPTQRALLMVVILFLGLLNRKYFAPSTVFAVALTAVLLLDPLAPMSISFWLSFSAVALILVILKRQIIKPRFQLLRLQLYLSLGMLPLTLIFFGTGSLSAPLANLIAIPWISLLVVPVSLLGVIFLPISEMISSVLFNFSGFAIHYLFQLLSLISEIPQSSLFAQGIPFSFLLLTMLAIGFLLLPKSFPGRYLGLILLLPAFLYTAKEQQQGAFSYALLDVGQGTASVIQTKNHVLIYDAGTRISTSFDIGKLVVNPYLKAKRIESVDKMILSHKNLDHYGGAKTIINEIEVKEVLSSDTEIIKGISVKACIAGQNWQWDGVNFEILWPMKDTNLNDNNKSCVLRVSNTHHSLLLTGDIQRKAEKQLVQKYHQNFQQSPQQPPRQQQTLQSEVIMMPHHGSKTSSTELFLKAVSPKLALISAGYRNRFGHPKQDVVKRYQALSIEMMDTITAGEIEIKFPASDKPIETHSYRLQQRRFWSRE